MNLDIGLYQGPDVSQQLNLAPQLLHWLKLLQAPTTDLASMVQHELETNPALEIDEIIPDSPIEDDAGALDPQTTDFSDDNIDARLQTLAEIDSEWCEEQAQTRRDSAEDQDQHNFIINSLVAQTSLHEDLLRQAALLEIGEDDRPAVELIIGSLDERGYLTLSLEELAEASQIPAERLEANLKRVQTLEPAGIAARDLRECLLLQMEDKGVDFLPARLLRDHPELLAARDFAGLAAMLDATEDEIAGAIAFIATLKPEPGRDYKPEATTYVKADVAIEKVDGEYRVELADEHIPHLRISASCRKLLDKGGLSRGDMAYIRRKVRGAMFLIQGIAQRQKTLSSVAREIARVQREFFENENGEIGPLTMAKVAQIIGVHETTVSRAIANKYIETPRGTYAMKTFFRAGYACADGSAMTPDRVKDLIASFIEKEPVGKPLTDLDIARLLQQQGLRVARRTIAKYREELGIGSSKERVFIHRSARNPAAQDVEKASKPAAAAIPFPTSWSPALQAASFVPPMSGNLALKGTDQES